MAIISSLLIEVSAGTEHPAADHINVIDGAEVFEIGNKHLAVVTEAEDADQDKAIYDAICSTDHVISPHVVFCIHEEDGGN